ncbi:perlucin-like protein [Mercenaria mercenaria]|uniref:perlucin-like protein n=1 Tax=Mercenaria mercenaria TaxID=6596 RepID=UPI00234EB63F|nr:perlucin-like protein [Mercenaria mercenaria]
MFFKVSFIHLMISYVLVNGDFYVRHTHGRLDSSSDSSESVDDHKMLKKIEGIETKLTEMKKLLEAQNSSAEVFLSDCPNEWIRYHNSCYFFGKKDVEFREAEIICEGYEATLVNIGSELEYSFIKSQLQERKAPKHWIGLTDENVEGEWRLYPSGPLANFIIWGKAQPEQGRLANCVAIWETYEYKYVDEPCTNRNFRPLCERMARF